MSRTQKSKDGEQINPDKIQIVWSTNDVLQARPDLNKREAREVLKQLKKNHDAQVGISWEVVSATAGCLFPKRKKK